MSGNPHQWINTFVAVLALVISGLSGWCNYESQAADRKLTEANRLRDQEAQQSVLKLSVLNVDVPTVIGGDTELLIELQVRNVGGSATSVVAARAASLADALPKLPTLPTLSISGPPARLEWALAEPAPPSHAFRPAVRIEPDGVAELFVRIRFRVAASTFDDLRRILSAQRDLGQIGIEDVNGQFSSVTLWDCAPKFPPKTTTCTGPVFR